MVALTDAPRVGCGCVQFKRAFKRNDKPICLAVAKFIAHLVNQQVADDMIALEIALLLLENPSGARLSTHWHGYLCSGHPC